MSNIDKEEEVPAKSAYTMSSIIGKPVKAGHVGIEVEVEFDGAIMDVGPGAWIAKQDGSLRNGMEFVSRAPFKTGPTLQEKVEVLSTALSRFRVVENSPRTSVHVHVNVLNKTPVEIMTAACAYWLVEQPLTQFCGAESRVGNHFCLRMVDAEGMYKRVIRDLLNFKSPVFSTLNPESMKYSALNLACLRSLGTLEVRTMRGTTDPLLISMWAQGCYDLVEMSTKNFSDPKALMNAFWNENKVEFLPKIVNKDFYDIIVSNRNYTEQVRRSAELVSLVAFGIETPWDKWLADRVNVKDTVKPSLTNQIPRTATEVRLTNRAFRAGNTIAGSFGVVLDDDLT